MHSLMNEPSGAEVDRVDSGRRAWRPLVAIAIIGLLIGGVLGGLYGASRPKTYHATASYSVLPDSTINSDPSSTTPVEDATSFIQGQLVVLNGDQLITQVQKRLGLLAKPTVSSVQLGDSYVVQVSATASTAVEAQNVATAVGAIYGQQRIQTFTTSINAQITSITAQLTSVAAELNAEKSQVSPAVTALQSEYQRLLSVNSSLKLALPQANTLVSTLSPASVSAQSLSASTKYGIGGALAGAILALALLVVLRRSIPRVRTLNDISGMGIPVLLPVMPRRAFGQWRGRGAWRSPEGRLLAARLVERGPGPHEPLIVVGPTSGLGTSYVAASLAIGLVERGPVLLILAAEPIRTAHRALGRRSRDGSRSAPANTPEKVIELAAPTEIVGVWSLPGSALVPDVGASAMSRSMLLNEVLVHATSAGWVVVVDAPALNESDLALDCGGAGRVTTLVVGRGRSRPGEVLSSVELFDAHGIPFAGTILNGVPRRRRRRRQVQPMSASIAPPVPAANPSPTRATGHRLRPSPERWPANGQRSDIPQHSLITDIIPLTPEPDR